jgi:uncharacterized protein involved in exopolysaccharide biosynthesis
LTRSRVELERDLGRALSGARGKQSQLARFQSSVGLNPTHALQASAIGNNENLSRLYEKRYQLTQNYAKLSQLYTDRSPEAQQVLSELKEINRNITLETGRTLGRAVKDNEPASPALTGEANMRTVSEMVLAQSQADDLSAQAKALQNQIGKLDRRISAVPAIEERIHNLQQTENSLSKSLSVLQEQVLDAQMKESQTLSNVFIIDHASLPFKPTAPNEKHLLIMSLLLGLTLGVSLTYLKWRAVRRTPQGDDFSPMPNDFRSQDVHHSEPAIIDGPALSPLSTNKF